MQKIDAEEMVAAMHAHKKTMIHNDGNQPGAARKIVCALLWAGWLLLAARLPAQSLPLYTRWVNYTQANGFPPGEVFCVTVDGNRVWAGTEHGLVLLVNGRIQKIFTTADGLVSNVIMGVAVDHKTGDVWIAAFGGASVYSGGTFRNFTSMSSGLANDLVYAAAVQGNFIWLATAAGASRLNTQDGSWSIFNETNAPFNEPWAYSIAVTPEKVYIGAWGGGVVVYDIAHHYWRPYTDPDGEMEIVLYRNQGLIHNIVSSVVYNPDTKMFWASTYFGLSGYDGSNWHNYLTKDSGLAANFVNAVRSRGNAVWACTQDGLSELDYATNTWITYRPGKKSRRGEILITEPSGKKRRLQTPTAPAHNYIISMDFQGDDIWVATALGLSHGIPEHEASNPKEKVHESKRD
jgi:ligand-binding sensor domain-containing protein